jgi:hypothetical protein
MPRFSHAGEERIRRAMKRGHSGDDPRLPIRRHSVLKDGSRFITWHGPVDHGSHEEPLWEMEIDVEQFRESAETRDRRGAAVV